MDIQVHTMSDAYLVENIKEILPEFSISENNFKNPSQDFIKGFFIQVLSALLGNVDKLFEVTPEDRQRLLLPDMADHLPHIRFFGVMKKIFKEIYVPDFQMSDLTNPTPKRTRKLFSALLNFLLFCDKMEEDMKPVCEAMRADVIRRNKLLQFINTLKESLNEKMVAHVENERLIEELNAKLNEKQETLGTLQDTRTTIKQEMDALKEECSSLQTESNILETRITELDVEINKLRLNIVDDPEKVKADLLESQVRQKEVDVERSESAARLKYVKQVVDKLSKIIPVVKEAKQLQREVIALLKEMKKEKIDVEQTKKQKLSVDEKIEEAEEYVRGLKIKNAAAMEQKTALKVKWEKKIGTIAENLEMLEIDYKKVSMKVEEAERLYKEKKKMGDEYEKKTTEKKEFRENYCIGMQDLYAKIIERVRNANKEARKSLKEMREREK